MVACVVLAACGPSVPIDGTGETAVDETTTASPTTADPTTSVTTSPTTNPTTMSTTATTVDPDTTGLVDSGDESSDSLGFIMDPDGYAIGLQCDPWAQDCARGDKCAPTGVGVEWFSDMICTPIAEDAAGVGAPCIVEGHAWSGHENCELGSLCWFFEASLEGTCVAHCTGSRVNPMCPVGHSCDVGFEGTVILCLPDCDPLAPACADGQTCMHGEPAGGPDFGHFVCQATAPVFTMAGYGEGCDHFGHACEPGLACVWPEHVPGCEGTCCTTLGDRTSPPVCPDPLQTCIAAYPDGDAPLGLEDLCFCGVAE